MGYEQGFQYDQPGLAWTPRDDLQAGLEDLCDILPALSNFGSDGLLLDNASAPAVDTLARRANNSFADRKLHSRAIQKRYRDKQKVSWRP